MRHLPGGSRDVHVTPRIRFPAPWPESVPVGSPAGGRSEVTVCQTTLRLTSSYAWISRFRMPMMSAQGTPGVATCTPAETLFAASPTISISLTSESCNFLSRVRSSRVLPRANAMASRAASDICRSRIRSSAFILNRGRRHHLIAKVPAEIFGRAQVYFSADES